MNDERVEQVAKLLEYLAQHSESAVTRYDSAAVKISFRAAASAYRHAADIIREDLLTEQLPSDEVQAGDYAYEQWEAGEGSSS